MTASISHATFPMAAEFQDLKEWAVGRKIPTPSREQVIALGRKYNLPLTEPIIRVLTGQVPSASALDATGTTFDFGKKKIQEPAIPKEITVISPKKAPITPPKQITSAPVNPPAKAPSHDDPFEEMSPTPTSGLKVSRWAVKGFIYRGEIGMTDEERRRACGGRGLGYLLWAKGHGKL